MKKIIVIYSVFISLGLVAGYAYYHFIGCSNDTCPITSSPTATTLYGALVGYVIGGIFVKDKKTVE